jgi:hypothetical protein
MESNSNIEVKTLDSNLETMWNQNPYGLCEIEGPF